MKVAIVSSCLFSVPPKGRTYLGRDMGWSGGYGGESQVYSFVRALCRAGHEVEQFCVQGSRPPPRGRLHYLPSGNWSNVFMKEYEVWEMYKDEILDCDVVHDWSLTKYVHHMVLATTREKKAIMTPWGTGAPAPYYSANCVLWSEFHRQLFLRQGFPKTTKYVHGAVEPAMFAPSYEPGKYFLYLSRTHPSKHHELVLRLAREMRFKLYLACDTESPDHSFYLDQAQKEFGRDENIRFVVDPSFIDKCILYRNASALILPSESECFGLVVLEALAHGTPVILLRDGAFPEIIEHGRHGFLCDDDDDFASAIRNVDRLIDRRECRKLVETKFNTDRMALEYEPIYRQVQQGTMF